MTVSMTMTSSMRVSMTTSSVCGYSIVEETKKKRTGQIKIRNGIECISQEKCQRVIKSWDNFAQMSKFLPKQ